MYKYQTIHFNNVHLPQNKKVALILIFVANLIGRHQDHLPIMYSSVTSLFGKAKEQAFNGNCDRISKAFVLCA
jgi:hypothetical protein